MESQSPDQGLAGDTAPITVGPLCLNPNGFSVSIGERDVALTLGEFLLLQELVTHPYQVLDRQRLAATLRESSPPTDEAPSSSRLVDTHISRLRAKLRRAGYDCIKTMRYVGYRFVPIEATPSTQTTG